MQICTMNPDSMHESIQGLLKLCCFTVHFDVDVFHSFKYLPLTWSHRRFCYIVQLFALCANRQWIPDEWWCEQWTTNIFILPFFSTFETICNFYSNSKAVNRNSLIYVYYIVYLLNKHRHSQFGKCLKSKWS